jgi:hypothetical protein
MAWAPRFIRGKARAGKGRRWSGSIAELRVGCGGLRLVRSGSAAVSRRRPRAGPGRRRWRVPGWRVRAAGGAPGSGSGCGGRLFCFAAQPAAVGPVTMPQARRSVLPGPAAMSRSRTPGSRSRTPGSRAMHSSNRAGGWSGHSSSPPRRMVTISRNLLPVSNCGCRLRADTRDQPPTAAKVPGVTRGSRPWSSSARSSSQPRLW